MAASHRFDPARRRLDEAGCIIGPNLQIPSPELVEMIALAGFDYVLLDGEHGAAYTRLPELLLAADAAGIPAWVRTPGKERGFILPPLEWGAAGVQVPVVETEAEARSIVAEAKYPPLGNRGFSLVSRAARFGHVDPRKFREEENREIMVVLQVETGKGLENAESIARVAGVDMIFIGPADLAQSLGHDPEKVSEETLPIIEDLVRRLVPLTTVGISAFTAEDVSRWRRLGVRSFLTSSIRPIRNALGGLCSELREGIGDS